MTDSYLLWGEGLYKKYRRNGGDSYERKQNINNEGDRLPAVEDVDAHYSLDLAK